MDDFLHPRLKTKVKAEPVPLLALLKRGTCLLTWKVAPSGYWILLGP